MMASTPKIRFKGFIDDWEQRKLGDVFEEYVEKNHPELPALTIIQGGGTVRRDESDRNILYDKASLAGYKLVRKNDFILHLRSFEGGLEKATCDGVISPAYHTFHGIDVDARFYYTFFRSNDFIKRKLVPHIYGIRDGKSIDVEGMKSIEIPYPNFREQEKIGKYIDVLDNLISLHQRKCEETKKLKKYMLQKMFPQNDKKIPEIRFAGFTDEWEQRKLGDEVTFYSGLTYSPDDVVDGKGVFVLRSSNVKNGEIINADDVFVNFDIVNSDNVKCGDIVVVVRNGSRALIGKHAQIKEEMNNTVIGAFMTGIRSKQAEFINALLDTSAFDMEIKRNLGATINQITGYMFNKMSFLFPKEEEEQKKIGIYFQRFDHLITLNQHKCDELKEVKKFMLQNMFPQKR
ncbi:MAG: restriction endonuclease subunit S [Clostridiales bacterium]|nr:restriction endonuclease subunit S [Clostridiales bacterium]